VRQSTWYCGYCLAYCPSPDDRWWWLWSNRWNENWQGKPKYSEKTCPNANVSTTNPTWTDPGGRGGKPATNRESYATTCSMLIYGEFKQQVYLCYRRLDWRSGVAFQHRRKRGLKVGGVYFTGLLFLLPLQGLGRSPIPMLIETFILPARFISPVIYDSFPEDVTGFLQRRLLMELPSSRCLARLRGYAVREGCLVF
jgi:hypothetical protein